MKLCRQRIAAQSQRSLIMARSLAGVATLALCAGQALAKPAESRPALDETAIAYYLPKLEAEVTGSFRLVSCAEKPVFKTEFTLVQKYVPDPAARVRLDTNIGFLANRTVKVEHYPDGTLKTFNGSWEGQGGKVITAAVKLAGAFVGVPIPGVFESATKGEPCGKIADDRLKALAKLEAQIAEVENRLPAAEGIAELLRARDVLLQKKAEAVKALTVARSWDVDIDYGPIATGPEGNCLIDMKPEGVPDYKVLFGNIGFAGLPAQDGITIKLCLQDGFAGSSLTSDTIKSKLAGKKADLLYRVPVPGLLTVTATRDSDGKAPTKTFQISVPQWANLSRLRLGKGGLFGSREAAAKFDAMGMPSELSYGSKSGADDIAGVLDTGREGVKALGNSELTRLQAEIALEEARQKLEALREADDTTGN
jgi:hypothetical protein